MDIASTDLKRLVMMELSHCMGLLPLLEVDLVAAFELQHVARFV